MASPAQLGVEGAIIYTYYTGITVKGSTGVQVLFKCFFKVELSNVSPQSWVHVLQIMLETVIYCQGMLPDSSPLLPYLPDRFFVDIALTSNARLLMGSAYLSLL